MTPKFDKLLGTLRENGAGATVAPSVGDISYFAADPGAGWLKCDGKVYDRAAYPGYEAQRPRPALIWSTDYFAADVSLADWVTKHVRADGKVLLSRWTSTPNVVVYDPATKTVSAPKLTLPVDSDGPGCFIHLSSGRIVLLVDGTRDCYTSDDLGETWTLRANALPAAHVWYDVALIGQRASGATHVPVRNSRLSYSTSDGVTWATRDATSNVPANEYASNLLPYKNLTALFGSDAYVIVVFGSSDYEHAYVYISGGAYILSGARRVTTGAPVDCICQAGTRFYLTGSAGIRYHDQPDGLGWGVGILAEPGPMHTADVVGAAGSEFFALSRGNRLVGWLSPDGKAIESAALENVLPVGLQSVYIGPQYGADYVCSLPGFALYVGYDLENYPSSYMVRVTPDPLKFHAPGLAPVGGAWPYVYVGA